MTNPAVIIPVTTNAVVWGFDDIDDNTLEESMIFLQDYFVQVRKDLTGLKYPVYFY